MRFAFYSVEGSTLSWQRRLVDEGCEVYVYQEKWHNRKIGVGLVNIAPSLDSWLSWGLRDANTIWFFDCTDAGELADRLRMRGCWVIGGGALMDRLEKDRPFGQRFAERCGVQQPPTQAFGTVGASLDFIKRNPRQQLGDGGWAWKPNRDLGASTTYVGDAQEVIEFLERVILPKYGDRVSNIVQERIPGVALSTARWWNGRRFAGPYEGTLEKKKLLNGEKGPATGCSLNMVWFYREEEPRIAADLRWPAIEVQMRADGAPPGLYDINAIATPKGAFFLEWTPRLGIDSELTSQRGIANLSEFLYRLVRGGEVADLFNIDRIYAAVRLSVPPYPLEDDAVKSLQVAQQIPISGADGLWEKHFVAVGVGRGRKGLEVADPYGFVGVALAAGTTLEGAYGSVYSFLDKRLKVPNLQYRTDGAQAVGKDVAEMEKAGYFTTVALEDV